jgi:hypothetical protein
MTLLTVVQQVCPVIGVVVPQSVFSNIAANRTMQEMLALANEAAQTIAYDTRDWTKLRTTVVYAGDGTTTAFNLPANYKRMLLTSNLWLSTSAQQPATFVADPDEWIKRRLYPLAYSVWGEWTMMGGQIHIFPAMAAGVQASFVYLDKNCIDLASGGHGDNFMSDNDSFTLDERVLKLGMIWRWKSQKGTAYAEDMGTYGDALNSVAGRDSPSPIIYGRPASTVNWIGWHGRIQ